MKFYMFNLSNRIFNNLEEFNEVTGFRIYPHTNNIIFICLKDDTYIRVNEEDAGIDLSNLNDIEYDNTMSILEHEPFLIETGVKVKLPIGFEAQVRPRSSLPLKFGMMVANSPGTIDASYRGDIMIQAIIFNKYKFIQNMKIEEDRCYLPKHTRLAQLIINPVLYYTNYVYEDEYNVFIVRSSYIYKNFDKIFPSKRGTGGFGSSGK